MYQFQELIIVPTFLETSLFKFSLDPEYLCKESTSLFIYQLTNL